MIDYTALLPYCNTERQTETITALAASSTQKEAAVKLGIHIRKARETLARVRRTAATRGYSPDHDMTHPVPVSHVVKGVSTLYADDGSVKQQWVKTNLTVQSQEEALRAFVDGLMDDLPEYAPLPAKPLTNLPEQLTAIVIGDAHIGMKVSNSRNKGEGEWSLEIAEAVTVGAVHDLVRATVRHSFTTGFR